VLPTAARGGRNGYGDDCGVVSSKFRPRDDPHDPPIGVENRHRRDEVITRWKTHRVDMLHSG